MLTKEEVFRLIESSNALPKLPKTTQQIFRLLSTPNTMSIEDLAERVEQDRDLTEKVLEYLNSDYFHLRRDIPNIKDALVFLGLESVRNFLIFFIAQKFFQQEDTGKSKVFNMKQYWRHVLATSIAAEIISEKLGKEDRYRLFFIGLNHDIGILVMNACLPEELDQITTKVMNGVHQIVAEKVVMNGITHDQIGSWICERWHFSPEVSRVIRYHHTPYLCHEDLHTLEIMFLADSIGTDYYEKLLNVHRNIPINKKVLSSLGISSREVEQIGEKLLERVEGLANRFIL